MPKKEIYVKKEESNEYDKFLEQCKRQGTSASEVFRKARIDWMIKHAPGNSLTRLTSFMETGQDTPAAQEGRIRQLCLEYNRKIGNNGVQYNYIREKVIEIMNLKGTYQVKKTEDIARWLHEQGVKVWR